jgi:hypothetical protein
MSKNEDIEFSDRHINMSELLTLNGQRLNGDKRKLRKFINNTVTALG